MPTYVIAEPELAAWLEANAKAAAESIEKSWWREPLQIVLASGDQKAIDTFVHCFKNDRAHPDRS